MILVAVLGAAIQLAGPAPAAAGSIAGCVSDTFPQPMPGPTIVAKAAGRQWTTVADGKGCYELKDLPAGSYRVIARLLGFDNVTRDRVVISAGAATRVDFTLTMPGLCECVWVKRTLAESWTHAVAVVHARLSDLEPGQSTSGFYRHATTILNLLKSPSDVRRSPLVILQSQAPGSPDPYDIGQEVVAFLEDPRALLKDAGPNAFVIANDQPTINAFRGSESTAMVFLVRDGRIQRAPEHMSSYRDMPVERFLDELRALSRR